MAEFKLPTEVIDLPSKGKLYPEDSPLRSGKIEMKYMTAKEEDILTNQSYIEKGIVIDKLLESLVVSDVNLDHILIGDKNALLVAARILGYGANYKFVYAGEAQEVDLSALPAKELDYELGDINEFSFTLPASGNEVTYKFLTQGDERKIDRELEGIRKLTPNNVPELSTRLKYIITSVNGERGGKEIREFVDKFLLAQDSRALREEIRTKQPDVDLSFFPQGSTVKRNIPIGIDFFYPDF